MSTTIVRQGILPFQSRLFKKPGKPFITEISQFQAQDWNCGDEPFFFRTAVLAEPLSAPFLANFNWAEPFCGVSVHTQPQLIGSKTSFSLAVLDIVNNEKTASVALANLTVGLRQTDMQTAPWTYSVHISDLYVSQDWDRDKSNLMICAAIADFIYDEMNQVDKQVKQQNLIAQTVINMTYDATKPSLVAIIPKLLSELDNIRFLINHISNGSDLPGLRVIQSQQR